MTEVENKTPDFSNLVRKNDYDAKILGIESTSDYNKFSKDNVADKIKSEGLTNKSVIVGFINNTDLDKKVATLSTKAELKAEQDKITKLLAFDSNYF